MTVPILRVEALRTALATQEGVVQVLDGVDIEVAPGEIVGLVGESGCGKSMTALSVMGLILPALGRVTGGRVMFDGTDLLQLAPRDMRAVRGRRLAMVFQDPTTFLNPVLTVGTQIDEMLRYHEGGSRAARWRKVIALLARVRIADPEGVAHAYPHQLSGGMRQRVLIAIALSCDPRLIIADEPTTALDVTVQAQILELLKDLVRQSGAGLLLITHDLGVVAETCDRVYVMYAGKVVETATVERLFAAPRHPYTRALLRSVLRADQPRSEFYALEGAVPNLAEPEPGCRFRARCADALPACADAPPPWAGTTQAAVSCWRHAP
jgi:oligopeptide/dipeptide ABC transporter ATP-binding protein